MSGVKGQKVKKLKEDSEKFPEYYKKHFPELTDEECIAKANYFRRSSNWQCIEYYEKNYPNLSHEEHLKLKQEKLDKKKSNSPMYIQYYEKRYPLLSSEERQKMCDDYNKQNCKQSIEYYNINFPGISPEEREQMRLEYVKEYTSKFDISGEKNGMHKSKTTDLQRRQISPKCIEFYELRYPDLSHEEHEKMLKDHYKNVADKLTPEKLSTRIEYYLAKGMTEEEAAIALKDRQTTFSLKKCIKKYGEIEGTKIFINRQQRWLKKLYKNFQVNGDGMPKQSKFAKTIIKECCKYLNIDIPKKELYINNTKNVYAYDFHYHKKLIEFRGDYWHCNPKLYDEDFFNKVKQKTAKDVWEYDYDKKITAERYGYEILYVWEYDYNEDPQREINRCINFLNDNS